MRKKIITSTFLSLLLLSIPSTAPAQLTGDFTVRAEIPQADGLTFGVLILADADADGQAEFLGTANTTDLNFGVLDLITTNSINIFLPDTFWGVDVGTNGAGTPQIEISYVDEENPNGAAGDGSGLEEKGVITPFVVTGGPAPEDQDQTLIAGKASIFGNLPVTITPADLTPGGVGGFLRVFIGLSDGSASNPTGAVPFTQADTPGEYRGTLTFTGTFNP